MSMKGFISKGIGFLPGSFAPFIRKGLFSAAAPVVEPNLSIPKLVRDGLIPKAVKDSVISGIIKFNRIIKVVRR
jgi:hypothetical protein